MPSGTSARELNSESLMCHNPILGSLLAHCMLNCALLWAGFQACPAVVYTSSLINFLAFELIRESFPERVGC